MSSSRIASRRGIVRLPALAADLARQNVDVIVAASPPAIQPAKDATRTIPIVMITGDDPVRSGFVAAWHARAATSRG